MVERPPADAGGTRDAGSIPGSGRSPIRAWEIPWIEALSELQFTGPKRVRRD